MVKIVVLPIYFSLFSSWLYYLSSIAPSYSDKAFQLKFPSNLEDLKTLYTVFEFYQSENYLYVFILFCSAYIYKQTFAIPGSFLLNILVGALYGPFYGFILACLLTSIGATMCYLLSSYCGKLYVEKYFSTKLSKLRSKAQLCDHIVMYHCQQSSGLALIIASKYGEYGDEYLCESKDYWKVSLTDSGNKIASNEDHLFPFLLFIRLFPMTPNWFINLSSPMLNIPLHQFFMSVFIGLMPYNMLCIQTGSILSQINSLDEVFSAKIVAGLLILSILVILPAAIKRLFFSKHYVT